MNYLHFNLGRRDIFKIETDYKRRELKDKYKRFEKIKSENISLNILNFNVNTKANANKANIAISWLKIFYYNFIVK